MAKVGIIMGSDSDLPIMQEAIDVLKSFGIDSEVDIVSAHRTPEKLFSYATEAHKRGIKVIIAGAGGAARAHRCRPGPDGSRCAAAGSLAPR